jgi:hypothetical protein
VKNVWHRSLRQRSSGFLWLAKKMIRLTGIVFAGFLICEAADASSHLSAQEPWDRCSGKFGSAGETACVTYIEGLTAGIELGQAAGKRWCFPEGGTIEQARLIIEKVMREHPEFLHEDAATVAAAALISAFPCDKSH